MVITVKNSVNSILHMVLSFVASSCILFVLECEFLALLFIIVYVGAIAVLFLFVVMMLDVKTSDNKNSVKYFPFGLFIGAVFLLETFSLMYYNNGFNQEYSSTAYNKNILYNYYTNWYSKIDTLTDIEVIGQILYTHYTVQFLISGLILFLVVIGAVLLTTDFSKRNEKNKFLQDGTKQISRNSLLFGSSN